MRGWTIMQKIYIIISQTHTGFARAVRKVGKVTYNHASIALDKDLDQIYSYARPKHRAVLLARLVKENVFRYTLGKYSNVPVVIFSMEVTDGQYEWIKNKIDQIYNDGEYLYNFYSVLSHLITGGFATYKSFSCIEFVMYLLQGIGYKLEKPLYNYRPDDLPEIFADSICFEGNLLDYKADSALEFGYYDPLTMAEIVESSMVPFKLLYRLMFKHGHNEQMDYGYTDGLQMHK